MSWSLIVIKKNLNVLFEAINNHDYEENIAELLLKYGINPYIIKFDKKSFLKLLNKYYL